MSVAFLGNCPHHPNRDAVIYFIKDIWPYLKKIVPEIKFHVIGRDPTPDILATAEQDQSIVVTGTVKDVRDYLERAKVLVAPIRLGKRGGTSRGDVREDSSGWMISSSYSFLYLPKKSLR